MEIWELAKGRIDAKFGPQRFTEDLPLAFVVKHGLTEVEIETSLRRMATGSLIRLITSLPASPEEE